jgi:hypothetical protein
MFYKRGDHPSRLRSVCIECLNGPGAEKGKWNFRNARFRGADKASQKAKNLFYNYGVTVEQYEDMFAKQSGLCAICLKDASRGTLNVDHDHETGRIRGLLCGHCNRGLGLLRDDPELLEEAARYLRN